MFFNFNFKKSISLFIIFIFLFEICSYSLGIFPASHNPPVKVDIITTFLKQGNIIRFALTDEEKYFLKKSNTDCVRLFSGQATHLVSSELFDDKVRLLRGVWREDIKFFLKLAEKDIVKKIKKIAREKISLNKELNVRSDDNNYIDGILVNALRVFLFKREKLISKMPNETYEKIIETIKQKYPDFLNIFSSHKTLNEAILFARKKELSPLKEKSSGALEENLKENNFEPEKMRAMYQLAEKFIYIQQKSNSIDIPIEYKKILAELFYHLNMQDFTQVYELEMSLVEAFKKNNIKSIFQMEGEDVYFLCSIAGALKKAGGKIMCVSNEDSDVMDSNGVDYLLENNNVEIIEEDINFSDIEKYDLAVIKENGELVLKINKIRGKEKGHIKNETNMDFLETRRAVEFEKMYIASGKFLESNKLLNVNAAHDGYKEILARIFSNLGARFFDGTQDIHCALAKALKENNIKSILEIGAGDCVFLAALYSVAKEAGCALTGIDVEPSYKNSVRDILVKNNVKIYKGDANNISDFQKYDLIIMSGVASLRGIYLKKNEIAPSLEAGYSLRELNLIVSKSLKIISKAITLLSENKKAVLIANTCESVVLAYKEHVASIADILLWDTARRNEEVYEFILRQIRDNDGRVLWKKIFKQAATLIVVSKKGKQAINKIDTSVSNDINFERLLRFDLLYPVLSKKILEYTIRYDESRLNEGQIEIIKEYSRMFNEKTGACIKAMPFSSNKGGRNFLIAVETRENGREFGYGEINLTIQGVGNTGSLEGYLLKMVGMLNIVLATASIPLDVKEDEINSVYVPILKFVKDQYENIFDTELLLNGAAQDILKTIRYIVMVLPSSLKVSEDIIEQYNIQARQALIAA
ncbi:hypothetical protein OMAG_001178 [Candidatus Omnitrophus magneticus]|uniref:Methyltransferase domain-containing protein n=1 Tax=Candidatus Omnitrophus magneticus TaxID=1609969 RepID=A0A0F0CNN9_9BACT|nr:hypothetical protein OMAG_001178 [Candidatus Omnitrophus magneticus]